MQLPLLPLASIVQRIVLLLGVLVLECLTFYSFSKTWQKDHLTGIRNYMDCRGFDSCDHCRSNCKSKFTARSSCDKCSERRTAINGYPDIRSKLHNPANSPKNLVACAGLAGN